MSTKAITALIMVILIVMVVVALGGCTHTVYVDRPVEVKVPMPVACLAAADVPAPLIYPADQLNKADTDGEIVGALLADRNERDAMEKVLRGIIDACTTERIFM